MHLLHRTESPSSLLLATFLVLTHLLDLPVHASTTALNLKKSIITRGSRSLLERDALRLGGRWPGNIEASMIVEGVDDCEERVRRLCHDDDEDYGAEFDHLEERQRLSQNEEEEQEVVRIKEPSFCS